MSKQSPHDVIEIKFAPVPAWMLMIFGWIFLFLGIALTTPFVYRQSIVLGALIASAALLISC